MSYLRRPLDYITTDGLIAKSLDSTQLRGSVVKDATLSVGSNDQAGVFASLSRLSTIFGGAARSNGEFEMMPQTDGVNGVTWAFNGSPTITGDTDMRITVGSSWTGAGNVLSDGVFLVEYLP